jgi:hypothetical protein
MKPKVLNCPKASAVTRSRKPTHTTLSSGDLLTVASQNIIRRAFKKGERKVVIKEREFTIEHKRGNEFLLVKPVLGRLPMASIQVEVGPTKKLQKWSSTPVEESKKRPSTFKRSSKKK